MKFLERVIKILFSLLIAQILFASCGSSSKESDDVGASIDPLGSSIGNAESDEELDSNEGTVSEAEKLLNELRSEARTCGSEHYPAVAAIKENGLLNQAALAHSRDMADNGYFNHNSLDGRDPGDRISATGYETFFWSENIALGQRSINEAMQGWIDSPGHCANIMSSQPNEFGIGEVDRYWTLVFGKR